MMTKKNQTNKTIGKTEEEQENSRAREEKKERTTCTGTNQTQLSSPPACWLTSAVTEHRMSLWIK